LIAYELRRPGAPHGPGPAGETHFRASAGRVIPFKEVLFETLPAFEGVLGSSCPMGSSVYRSARRVGPHGTDRRALREHLRPSFTYRRAGWRLRQRRHGDRGRRACGFGKTERRHLFDDVPIAFEDTQAGISRHVEHKSAQATLRSCSSRPSHSRMRFQLVKMRLTTTFLRRFNQLRCQHAATRTGIEPSSSLQAPCRLMVDELTAVPRTRLGKRLGSLAREEMKTLNRAVFVFLGLTEPM
jgi:PemK-like, MazF-like toxin of type II toxin-antitoxin system